MIRANIETLTKAAEIVTRGNNDYNLYTLAKNFNPMSPKRTLDIEAVTEQQAFEMQQSDANCV